MKNAVRIKKLSFSYKDNKIFNNLDLSIEGNKWYTIIGSNGSGKSTLAKLITGTYAYNGIIDVNVDDDKIGLVCSSNELKNTSNTIHDEICKLNLEEEYEQSINKLLANLNLDKYLDTKICNLSNSYKILFEFVKVVSYNPKILILDGTLDELDYFQKINVIKILKKFKKNDMTIINITNDIENTLLGDNIILLDSGEIRLSADKYNFFENDKILKTYGINLPFIVDLSIKLKYYGMIDKIYLDMEELVDALWG